MRITLLHGNQQNYSCNAYLVRGDSNEPEDVNTLVDVGIDGSICGEIENLCTGIGKKKVAQVVLTHGHYDHAAGLGVVVACYHPRVCAFAPGKHVDVLLLDGQCLRLGDREFEVLHTPGHSEDSICLYCARERTLFAGDTPARCEDTRRFLSGGTPGFAGENRQSRRGDNLCGACQSHDLGGPGTAPQDDPEHPPKHPQLQLQGRCLKDSKSGDWGD